MFISIISIFKFEVLSNAMYIIFCTLFVFMLDFANEYLCKIPKKYLFKIKRKILMKSKIIYLHTSASKYNLGFKDFIEA